MGYFDRVTVSLHILYTANQETEGSQDRLAEKIRKACPFFYSALRASVALRATCRAPDKVDLGQMRSEEIVYSRFIEIPFG